MDVSIQAGKIQLVREILYDGVIGAVRVLGRCAYNLQCGARDGRYTCPCSRPTYWQTVLKV